MNLSHKIPSINFHRNTSTELFAGQLHNQNSRPSDMPSSVSLVLFRGLPGSGKTTMASVLRMIGYKHFEADMYFEVNGAYQYEASRIRDAHDWCKQMTREALRRGENVVVSNTFTRLSEMEPYYQMDATNIRVIEATGNWANTHGVSNEIINRMSERWELLR
jgi:hypothetical protein